MICGVGVMLCEWYCDNFVLVYGGSFCEGRYKDRKLCVIGEVCIGRCEVLFVVF